MKVSGVELCLYVYLAIYAVMIQSVAFFFCIEIMENLQKPRKSIGSQ